VCFGIPEFSAKLSLKLPTKILQAMHSALADYALLCLLL